MAPSRFWELQVGKSNIDDLMRNVTIAPPQLKRLQAKSGQFVLEREGGWNRFRTCSMVVNIEKNVRNEKRLFGLFVEHAIDLTGFQPFRGRRFKNENEYP